jgi:hypothetical protein
MNVLTDAVRLPSTNDLIAPVRILDADGHLVCVVSADEFRRMHPSIATTDSTSTAHRRPPLNGPLPRSVPLRQVLASSPAAARPLPADASSPKTRRMTYAEQLARSRSTQSALAPGCLIGRGIVTDCS